jgi:hypothetical protein
MTAAWQTWPTLAAQRLILFYRRFIGILLPAACRFEPSCSSYALAAYERHGFWRGSLLTAWRLCRCHPFCNGGHDPVPEKFLTG